MKKAINIFTFLLISNTLFAQFNLDDFKKLHTLIGNWESDNKKELTHQFWNKTNETTLQSKSLKISEKDTTLLETVKLQFANNLISYTVSAVGQNNEKPIIFTLKKIENNTFFFENLSHDFPQKIIYNLISNSKIQISIEGNVSNKYNKIDYNLNRMKELPLKVSLNDVLSKIPGKNGEQYALGMRNGTMRLLVYAPRGKDDQQPHKQDEVYIVVSGKGTFVCGDKKVEFAPNDVLFVPAGVKHHFENFTDDFVTWVVFYGVEGGEK